jgi:Multiubiquitin
MPEHKDAVRIRIDEERYESPNPTTGEALYRLGHVKHGLKLYREVRGDREDPAIENGPEIVHLKEDEHFHSGKPEGVTIIVEGTPHEWDKPEISYVEVVTLFDPTYPQHPETTYSVKYRNGPSPNPEGVLSPGSKPVNVKDKMVFNVSKTGQS